MIRPGSDQMTSSLTANASGKGGSLAVRQPSARHDENRQSLGRRACLATVGLGGLAWPKEAVQPSAL
jgi:hypothetical protein